MSMHQPIIQIEHLYKSFPGKEGAFEALSDVSLEIDEGEIFGIIGMSGAGKSTLVRCINLLEKPDRGTVRVAGTQMGPLRGRSLREMRSQIGMIFQQFNLLMQKTALQNVCFPLLLCRTPRKEAEARALQLLELVGLGDKVSSYPSQLSGGQKQRVAIARALARNPKILLCDEATSALDNATTGEILALLRDINQKMRVTIVIITHEMAVIEQVCHRVAVIDQGRIAETAGVSQLFTTPRSQAAKKLVLNKNRKESPVFGGEQDLYRIVFNGSTSTSPILSEMILACGTAVNVLHADLQEVEGRNFGQMVVQLPPDNKAKNAALNYLASRQISVEELNIRV